MQYVARGLSIFVGLLLGVMLIGFYCHENQFVAISMFDKVFIAAFILGGAFPYLLSSIILDLVEENTDEMVRNPEEVKPSSPF